MTTIVFSMIFYFLYLELPSYQIWTFWSYR